MGDFHAGHPEYAATRKLDQLRATEYSYLDETGNIYLDYTGAGLPAKSQVEAYAARVGGGCYGNPHSDNPTSTASTALVDQARTAVLRHFNTTRDDYVVIFTPNATGACRLVGESYSFGRRSRLVLAADNHNSVIGIREFASARGAKVAYVPLAAQDLRINDSDVTAVLAQGARHGRSRSGLFAFPAQSNFSGVQHPLTWVTDAQRQGYDVLLDAAAYVATNRLDLSAVRPEFVAVSWYKVFGHPTGVGCLLVRRDALPRLRRPWFSGGTIWVVTVQGGWHRMLDDESAFEDGTVNFLSIPDVTNGLDWINGIGVDLIHQRVSILTGWLLDSLAGLKHSDGSPMIRLYGPADQTARGATISFNFLDTAGHVVDERAVARDARAAGISLRTGCFCNPGAGEWAFGVSARDVRGPWWHSLVPRGFMWRSVATLDDFLDRVGLPSGGAVRISLGVASNIADAEAFLDFAERTYRDRCPDLAGLLPRTGC